MKNKPEDSVRRPKVPGGEGHSRGHRKGIGKPLKEARWELLWFYSLSMCCLLNKI